MLPIRLHPNSRFEMSEKLEQLKKKNSFDLATTFHLGKHEHQTTLFQVSYFLGRYPELTDTISNDSLSKLIEKELSSLRGVFD